MKLGDFHYDLPDRLIAQHPLEDRGMARLLVLTRDTGDIEHVRFKELGRFFKAGDMLVINNTRVFRARLLGTKATGGRVEILLLKEGEHEREWQALIAPARRVTTGARITIDTGIHATVRDKKGSRCTIVFNVPGDAVIERHGSVPLPHYIKRAADKTDIRHYQTVFAKKRGSVAAPTAGLHFTKDILKDLKARGVLIEEITLHIGPGTFKPIRTDEIEDHTMDPEYYEIPDEVAQRIQTSERITAVGTSVCRALETYGSTGQRSGNADLFIYPGHSFKTITRLVTNFHLPRSTPLLLTSAFAGKDLIFKAYREAIRREYRFLSYGDAMLVM
jgi:S-adenosylmethionine:tRNA ribosyltransferase-isomerase